MKRFLAIIIVSTLFCSLLTACGNSSPASTGSDASQPTATQPVSSQPATTQPASTQPEAQNTSEPAAAPGGEKQVVIGINADYLTFDFAHAYEFSANPIFRAIYDTLVTFEPGNPDLPAPSLATDWSISEDGKVYTFNLKKGIPFSTGGTLTSKDVKWSFERLIAVKGNPSVWAEGIASIEAPDEQHVVITLNEVDPAFLTKITQSGFSVVDSQYIQNNFTDESAIEEYLTYNTATTAPYVIETFEPNNQLVLSRNPVYAGPAPAIDRFVFRHMNDSGAQLMALQKGDLDFAFDLEDIQIQTVTNDQNIQILSFPTASMFFHLMNMDPGIGGPVSNEKVREAIGCAMDYDGILQLAGRGASVPYSIIPQGLLGSGPPNQRTRDLEKAKALLSEAGYAGGFSVDCAFIPDMAPDGVSFQTMAEKLQADLAEVGITVKLVPEQVAVFLDNYRSGKHQMNVNMWGADYPDALNQIAFLPGESVGLRANWTVEMDPSLADLAARVKVEVDNDKRKVLLEEIQDKCLNGPFLVYLQPGRTFACSKKLANVQYTAAFQLELLSLDIK